MYETEGGGGGWEGGAVFEKTREESGIGARARAQSRSSSSSACVHSSSEQCFL